MGRVDQPDGAWQRLSTYRNEIEPDYVFPYKQSPWTAEPMIPYPHSKILTSSFAQGLVQFEHILNGLDANSMGDLEFRVFWEDHRFYRKSLLDVSLVCKSLYVMVQPVLLRTIELKLDRERSSPAINRFLARLTSSKVLASNVRAFSLMLDWSYLDDESRARDTAEPPHWDEAGWSASSATGEKLSSIAQPDFCWLQPAYLIPFLGSLPKLQALKLNSPWKPQILQAFTLGAVDNPLSNLQNLTEISFHWLNVHKAQKTEFDVLELLPVFSLPNIRTLLFNFESAYSSQEVSETSQYNEKSSATEIILIYWDIGESALSALLRLPANLQTFTFISGDPFIFYEEGTLNYKGITRSLLTQADSLKSVTIQAPYQGPEWDDLEQTSYQRETWKQFKVLEDLSTPLRPLLEENKAVERRLEEQLPQNLVNLTLYVDEEFNFETWSNQVTSLISNKETCCPKLEKIRLEVRYGELREARQAPDFDGETMRAACLRDYTSGMEGLGWLQLAREKNIKIEVFFDKVDRDSY